MSVLTTTSTTEQPTSVRERPEDRVFTPRADVLTGDEAVILQVDLPGVSREGLVVEVKHNQLTLEGRRSESVVYRRVFGLPDGIDVDHIDARLEHGVLTLTLPKAASHKPRRIEVRG